MTTGDVTYLAKELARLPMLSSASVRSYEALQVAS